MATTDLQPIIDGLLAGKGEALSSPLLAAGVHALTQQLGDSRAKPVGELEAVASLSALRMDRQFELAAELGDALLARVPSNAALRRNAAQVWIELGGFDRAEPLLSALAADPAVAANERLEAKGLLGRIAKQRFVNLAVRTGTIDDKILTRAIDLYLDAYEADPGRPAWHGINAVALLCRAERERVGHPRRGDRTALATAIRQMTRTKFHEGRADAWDLATAAEACLALDQHDEAELWLYRYVAEPDLKPFLVGSTQRQLAEVWTLRRDAPPGDRLLLILERRLAKAGLVRLDPGDAPCDRAAAESAQQFYEKVFGKESFLSYSRWQFALGCCACVARIDDISGTGVGTGFLVRGDQLHASLPAAPVLLTNAHVIGDDYPGALPPAKARIRFEVQARQQTSYAPLQVDKLCWRSPPDVLDTAIVSLRDLPDATTTLELSFILPALDGNARAYVIGHPGGDSLALSLHDNEILDIDDAGRLVHYRSPTLGGSSGSPVFNGSWEVFAIHHAGSERTPRLHTNGFYPANEGISVSAVRAAIADR